MLIINNAQLVKQGNKIYFFAKNHKVSANENPDEEFLNGRAIMVVDHASGLVTKTVFPEGKAHD